MDAPDFERAEKNDMPFLTMLRTWAPIVIISLLIAVFARMFLIQAYEIPSLSMAPALDDGDRVIVNRLSYRFGEIERGQVVVFDTPPNQISDADFFIKRVIGLPGEVVDFRGGEVYVDGLLVQEPYLAQSSSTDRASRRIPGCAQDTLSAERCEVPTGFVFVLGDNRNGSEDSRVFGPVPIDTVVGRATARIWPLNDFSQL